MDIPGATSTPDREALQKAEEQTEKLHEELKKQVKTEGRDIGVLRKELRIMVPAQVIADHMDQNYSELMHDAFVPGFRKGRAPRRLIEKRYGSEVRQSLTSSVVAQSFFAAIENEGLDVLGDPLFSITSDSGTKLLSIDEALQHLKLPEAGDFSYTCEIELKPKFELPELKGIPIIKTPVQVTDAMVDEQMLQRRKIRGRLEPVSEGVAEKDDLVIADVVLTVAGQEVKREENVTIGVRPARLEGIPLLKLEEVLSGVAPGETRRTECTVPDDFEQPDLRGKAGQFTFKIHELKRVVPQPLAELLQGWGFDSEDDARKHFRRELELERDQLLQRMQKGQIEQYLLEHTTLDLPADFSTRQTERAVMRRVIELQQRGVPVPDIEARIDELRTTAKDQVAQDLKLGFIFEKVAEKLEVTVTDEEVNTEIARIARMYNRRFDRVRDELQARGLLDQLVEQIRQRKCVERLLADAQVEEAAEEPAKAKTPRRRKKAAPASEEGAVQKRAKKQAEENP
jgi:trigger factor